MSDNENKNPPEDLDNKTDLEDKKSPPEDLSDDIINETISELNKEFRPSASDDDYADDDDDYDPDEEHDRNLWEQDKYEVCKKYNIDPDSPEGEELYLEHRADHPEIYDDSED